LDCLIVIMHEVIVPMPLLYAILVTLSSSSFMEPDLMEGTGLVNDIASFVKFLFCIMFLIKLKQILADRLDDRFINTSPVHCLE
jgi:hypothetical protein